MYYKSVTWWEKMFKSLFNLFVCHCTKYLSFNHILLLQLNCSCKSTPFSPEIWPFKRGGFSSGVGSLTFMLKFIVSVAFPDGLASRQGGLSTRFHGIYVCDSLPEILKKCGFVFVIFCNINDITIY